MRTISAALQSEQQADYSTPFIKLEFFSWDGSVNYDYSTRCISLEHREALFSERATIILYNSDRAVPDLTGYWVCPGYGYYTGNNVAEPNGDNAGNEYSYAPRLYVRHQQDVSAQGVLVTALELTGIWGIIRDTLITLGDRVNSTTGMLYNKIYNDTTIMSIISDIIDNVSRHDTHKITYSWASSQYDDLFNVIEPVNFSINREPFEYASDVIYDLLSMTKTYLISKTSDNGTRPPTPDTNEPRLCNRYPSEDDSVDLHLYDTKAHWFYEFEKRSNIVVPNKMYVFCNKDGDNWDEGTLIIGEAEIPDQIARFMEVPGLELAPDVTDQTTANNLADALLSKVPIEAQRGRVLASHHCGLELLDRVRVHDSRGY